MIILYLSQTSDQTCATLVVDDDVVDNTEPDDLVALNPECNAFKTPESK